MAAVAPASKGKPAAPVKAGKAAGGYSDQNAKWLKPSKKQLPVESESEQEEEAEEDEDEGPDGVEEGEEESEEIELIGDEFPSDMMDDDDDDEGEKGKEGGQEDEQEGEARGVGVLCFVLLWS